VCRVLNDLLADIALTAFGAAASSSTSTKAAFDRAKAMARVTICWPTGGPFEIPDANARLYVIGPSHDPKLIRKINPSTSSPETYGLAMNGAGALPLGVISALDNRKAASGGQAARTVLGARDEIRVPTPTSIPFHRSPGSFKRSQMADYLSAMAPVSTNALSWLGESGHALARYRAFLKHARKLSSHDQQSPQHGV
jgi:hypothetical protein